MALSLGEVQYRSYVDEPLSATIELLGIEGEQESLVSVEPASAAEYARIGLEHKGLVAGLITEVSQLPSGKWLVHISSRKPVSEAQLNLALRAQWPDGAVVQKYTLLLDEPPETVSLVDSDLIYETAQGELEMLEAESTESMQDLGSGKVWSVDDVTSQNGMRRVAAGQSLSDIAVSLRPANTVSVDQMMVAIANKNPEAFADGLFSKLETGQLLKVPDSLEINSIERAEARRTVALETLKAGMAESEGASPERNETVNPNGGILRLGSIEQSELPTSANSRGKKVQSKNFKGSRTDLGRRLDNVLERLEDANGIINQHLTEIDALNVTVADLSHTIDLKNSELARMLQAVSVLESRTPANDAGLVQPNARQANNRSEEAHSSLEQETLETTAVTTEDVTKQPFLNRFSAALFAFFASIFAFLTLSRWRNSRAEAIAYDPLSEEMALQEKADAIADMQAKNKARSEMQRPLGAVKISKEASEATAKASRKTRENSKTATEPTKRSVSAVQHSIPSATVQHREATVKLKAATKTANESTEKPALANDKAVSSELEPGQGGIQVAAKTKSVASKEAEPITAQSLQPTPAVPSVSISVSMPVSTQRQATQKPTIADQRSMEVGAINEGSDIEPAKANEAPVSDATRLTGMLDTSETMLDDVADEFDANVPVPWSPPLENKHDEEHVHQGEIDDGDVATLNRSIVKQSPLAPLTSKVAVESANHGLLTSAALVTRANSSLAVQTEKSIEKEQVLDLAPAVDQLSDLELLLNEDLGFGSELAASPLETAQAYIELDDIDAATRVLNEIIADSSSAEHLRATQLLADIKS